MNQISELDIKLKSKEKELSDMTIKYKNVENNFMELNKDMKSIYITFDEISDSFNHEISLKEQYIHELTQKLEKYNNPIQENNNIGNSFQEEINKYKTKMNELDSNYKKLISDTILIKKTFFNHMNMVIMQKNQEMSKFKESQEEKVMHMEEILSAEKIFNKNSINHKINNLNNTIIEYKTNLNLNIDKLNSLQKTNTELKSKELFLERELKIYTQKNEKLTDNNIELTNELRQKHKDNAYLSKLVEQIKKDKVDSIKLLNSTHQSKLDYLNEKLNQLSESIREKENEDSKKYQQYIEMKEQYINLTKEKDIYIQQIKKLNFDIQEKNKKIDELLLTQSQMTKTAYSNTNDLTIPLDNEDIIYYKKIDKGLRCIFVPFYENIFVCINLSENMLEEKKGEIPHLSNYDCKYILDLNSFNNELSKIIVDNSLIVIGKISKLTEIEQSQNKLYNLPKGKNFVLVTLGKVDYVIGFPENELMFNNYIN
jgi:chromosome segregation ATPase